MAVQNSQRINLLVILSGIDPRFFSNALKPVDDTFSRMRCESDIGMISHECLNLASVPGDGFSRNANS
ncbi:MAG: hypothetical protein AB2700_18345, partial [Candidatus Thiodiazotropha taylori]